MGISEQTFYRWKKQYVGMETDQARQMKQLQEENSRLKQLVADLSLDKTMLQDVKVGPGHSANLSRLFKISKFRRLHETPGGRKLD